MLQQLVSQIEQKKKNCLPKTVLCQQTKTADDDNNNKVATHTQKKHNNQPNCGTHQSNNIK